MRIIRVSRVKTFLQWGILLMCLKTSFSMSAIVPYSDLADNILTALATICLVAAIVQKGYSINTLLTYLVLSLLSLFSVIQTGNYGFLVTIIVCLAAREKELDKILRFIYQFELAFLVVHTIAAAFLDLVGVHALEMNIYGVIRYSFGFAHPNTFSIYLFNVLLLWSWLNYEKISGRHIVIIFLIAVVAAIFTKTRTSFLTSILFCLLVLVSKSKYSIKKGLNGIAKFIFPLCAASTLAAVHLYLANNALILLLNALLSSRIKLGAYALSHFGYSVLGQDISRYEVVWDTEWRLNGFTFDNLYTFLAFNQGIVWILLLSLAFYLLAKKNNLKTSVFIIIWTLYGITEVHGLNGFRCFPIFLIVSLLEHGKSKRGQRIRPMG